jgi:hypothetical protein
MSFVTCPHSSATATLEVVTVIELGTPDRHTYRRRVTGIEDDQK